MARHWSQRCVRLHGMARKWSWSACVQEGLVVWAHVRRFQISRTAFAVMPNRAATLAAKVPRTSRSALASKIWIACTHTQAEYVCNVPECIASNQFSCRHRALRSVAHAVIHHTCSPLSVVAGLGARSLACAAMRGPARTLWAVQQGQLLRTSTSTPSDIHVQQSTRSAFCSKNGHQKCISKPRP